MSEPLYARPGDIFFTRSSSLLGRLIRWAESDPREEKTWANHVGVVVGAGWLVPPQEYGVAWAPAIVIESLGRTQQWAWWENHRKEVGNEIRVYRRVSLAVDQLHAILDTAETFVGARYGWWKLFAHLADRVAFKGKKTVSRLLHIDKRPICSYTAAKSFAAGGVLFNGIQPEAADPDELMDLPHSSEPR